MARLTGYENTRTLETGSQFMRPRPVPDQTAKAGVNFGNTLESVATNIMAADARLNAKAEAEANRVAHLEMESNVIRVDTEERLRLQAAKENATPSGAGFYDGYIGPHDKRWQAELQTIDPRLRPDAERRFMANRERIALDASAFEHARKNQFTVQVSSELDKSLTTDIKAGRINTDSALGRTNEFVDGLALPPNRAAELKRRMGVSIEGAHIDRQIELNPHGVLRDLAKHTPGNVTSDNPHIQRNIEASTRNGIPLNVILPLIQGETAFNPTEDMSKKTNPKTGRPYSSASGYGQLLDSNWAEVGMTKSSDPDVQAEAIARLTKQRINHLQRNGIEITPANVAGAHLLGPGAYTAILRAAERNPNTPLRDILQPLYKDKYEAAVTGNGKLLVDGSTVGATIKAIADKSARNAEEIGRTTKVGTGAVAGTQVEVGGQKLGYLTPEDTSRYFVRAQSKSLEISDAALQDAIKSQVEDGLMNPYTSGDRKAMDKHAAATGVHSAMNTGDPNAYGAAKAFMVQNKYLPKPYAEEAELALLSPDPARRKMAYDLLSNVEIVNPLGGLQASGIRLDIKKRVERFSALQTQMGFSPEQARTTVEREFDPNFEGKVKRDSDRINNIVKRQSMSAVETHMESSNGIFRGTAYASDATKRQALLAFQESVRFHLNDGAEETTAVALAKAEMGRAYGVDNSFGNKRIMHWPPNKVLPAGPDGTHKWVAETVVDHVNRSLEANERFLQWSPNLKFKVDASKVFLIGTAETGRTAMLGEGVKYEVAYIDNKGRRQTLPGGYTVSPEEAELKRITTKLRPLVRPRADVGSAREAVRQRDLDAATAYSNTPAP